MIRISSILDRVLRRWQVLTLARQYLLAGAAVLIVGMLAIGLWVTSQIARGVTQNTATATALYVDGVIAPLLPNIDGWHVLSDGASRALDETLSFGELGKRVLTFKLWGKGGLITYSNDASLIGKRFPPSASLKKAWSGHVAAEFDNLTDDEDASERDAKLPLLEIYTPIREPWSGEVIAVAEFYEHAEGLRDSLYAVKVRSWIVVAVVAAAMMGALFGIVLGGSATIARQRSALEARVTELQQLLAANHELGRRVRDASSRVSALNERMLRQLSADLHDGPAQLIGLASLRLGSPSLASVLDEGRAKELRSVRGFLDEAMGEIRGICHGMALPSIETLDLNDLLVNAARSHERRTGTAVALAVPPGTVQLAPAERIGVYRFVQEGLSNAFRHAAGKGQAVSACLRGDTLEVEVRDSGGGVPPDSAPGLGLTGLQDRVESLGGTFEVRSDPTGTRLLMTLSHLREIAA